MGNLVTLILGGCNRTGISQALTELVGQERVQLGMKISTHHQTSNFGDRGQIRVPLRQSKTVKIIIIYKNILRQASDLPLGSNTKIFLDGNWFFYTPSTTVSFLGSLRPLRC